MPGQETFPHASARTQRFTRGAPRSLQLDPTGARLLFVRSSAGDDPVGSLWALDTATGEETLVADPRVLLGDGEEDLSDEERSRRERSREAGAGVVGYATDESGGVVAFALSSRLWLADLRGPEPVVRELPAEGPVVDPRPDPAGRRVAYAAKAARCTSSAPTGRATGPWSLRTGPRCTGGSPSSSPPRRWAATAGSGGRPTARRCWWHGSTTHRCSGGTWPTRPTRSARRPSSPTPRPARPTPTSPCTSSRSTAHRATR